MLFASSPLNRAIHLKVHPGKAGQPDSTPDTTLGCPLGLAGAGWGWPEHGAGVRRAGAKLRLH